MCIQRRETRTSARVILIGVCGRGDAACPFDHAATDDRQPATNRDARKSQSD